MIESNIPDVPMDKIIKLIKVAWDEGLRNIDCYEAILERIERRKEAKRILKEGFKSGMYKV